jgi:hypothetical protein
VIAMSVGFYVYLREEQLPSRDEWQQEIDRHGIHLKLDEFSTREHRGFLPAVMNGADCGFEYAFQPVDETVWDDGVPQEIGDRNRVVTFKTHGGREQDSEAAMLAAAVLTELTKGVYEDPQGGGFAEGGEVFDLLRDQEDTDRKRRRLEAAKWATITTRRCAECGSPCPEYRKTCKVCGIELGRV